MIVRPGRVELPAFRSGGKESMLGVGLQRVHNTELSVITGDDLLGQNCAG
jgi:hypothetical protein